MTTPNGPPCLPYVPYLPLRQPYQLGPWLLTPLKDYTGRWLSSQLEQLSKQFLTAFRDAWDQPLENPAILASSANGMNGRSPSLQEVTALQSAIDLSVIDRRPAIDDPNGGHAAATSDNAEVFVWPIDVAQRLVTLERGYLVRSRSGGHQIDDSLNVRAPLELQIPIWNLALDADLLSAVYELATRNPANDPAGQQIVGAIHWLSKAWRNSASVDFGDRVVFLRSGFEVLSGTDENWACAKWLRTQYERLLTDDLDDATAAHLLWSPSENERYERRIGQRGHLHRLTDLQEWFMAFGDVRNSIMHGREVADQTYHVENSTYNGNFVMTGERLLRESIKVRMARLGYPKIWRNEEMRLSDRAVGYLSAFNETAGQTAADTEPQLTPNSRGVLPTDHV